MADFVLRALFAGIGVALVSGPLGCFLECYGRSVGELAHRREGARNDPIRFGDA